MKRLIRLKEFAPNSTIEHVVPDWYRSSKEGTISEGPFWMHVDRWGFVRSSNIVSEDGPFVVFLGDSVTEGMYVSECCRFPAVVEKHLRLNNIPLSCLNGGYSGATVLHLINVLLNKVVSLRPLIVVFIVGVVDGDACRLKAGFWSNDEWLSPIQELGNTQVGRDYDFGSEARFLDRNNLLFLCINICRIFAIEPILCTFPHRVNEFGSLPERSGMLLSALKDRASDRMIVNNHTRGVAAASNCRLLDIEAFMMDKQSHLYDEFHPNDVGAVLIGDFIAQNITELVRNLLDRQKVLLSNGASLDSAG